MRTRFIERGLFVGVMDNLHSQNPLLSPSFTTCDPTALWARAMRFYQPAQFSWDCILRGGRVLVYEQLKRVRATEHLGGHKTYPHTPLFIAYGADYVTSNNAKHKTKRETLDPNVH